ncbi:hypothetical protein AX17_001239 [Amanita inopinata Kibby_2008]|nr:hypothetical protein AX17_001239 [Amanita inopinata Kibby_2008]
MTHGDHSNCSEQYSRSSPSLAPPLSQSLEAGSCLEIALNKLTNATSSLRLRKKNAVRRNFSLSGPFTKDSFSSLIHSHSHSRHQNTRVEDHLKPTVDLSDYADLECSRQDSQTPIDMSTLSSQANLQHERPSRKQKSENRFYSFLSRSQSRSRSKDARFRPTDNAHTEQTTRDAPTAKALPDAKPPNGVPSRPLSSNTTATNTTITPRPKRRPSAAVTIPQIPTSSEQISSSSATSKPLSARRKLHNLFGISLASQKKSTFDVAIPQRKSPRASLDIPPLPTQDQILSSTSKHRKASSLPTTSMKTKAITTNIKSLPLDSVNIQCPASASVVLHKLFPGTDMHRMSISEDTNSSLRIIGTSRETQVTDMHPPVISVSAPVRHPSHHRSGKSEGKDSIQSDSLHNREPQSRGLGAPAPPPPPHIVYTPATPERTARAAVPSNSGLLESKDSRCNRKASIDSTGQNTIILKENIREKEREATAPRYPFRSAQSNAVTRSTRHGSFDFERPNWNAVAVQRNESGTTTGTISTTSEWSRHADRVARERESSFGPGLAGVGTLQREISLKRGKEREEHVRARDVERRKLLQQQRKQKNEQAQLLTTQDAQTVRTDYTGGSASTNGTGHSSSWGKAAGKRSVLSGRTGSGSGLPRLIGLTQHPPFNFEPPVPLASSRNASATRVNTETSVRLPEERPSNGKARRKASGPREEGVLAPLPASIGHRSAFKGRSLDLGLGLAWAPSTVREEALLPSSTFRVGRSFSQSSSTAVAANDKLTPSLQRNGDPRKNNVNTIAADIVDDISKLGKEVANAFRNALDDEGYNCVHQFDAHEIPFDGPSGIATRVEQLLNDSPALKQNEKRELMDRLIRIILRNA